MPTGAGQLAASIHEYLDGRPLDARRMLLILRTPGGRELHYAWNMTTAGFEPADPVDLDTAMGRYPFGVRMFFADFARDLPAWSGPARARNAVSQPGRLWLAGAVIQPPPGLRRTTAWSTGRAVPLPGTARRSGRLCHALQP
ncbi:hypothetical protein ACFWGI_32275 [Streptomyces niveus]|uniref:hypothetical protein n=1 Tax=Streptomyces niveus TaxID=193462 RepID=UPI00365EC8BD